ncbi:MAG: nucleotide exchange factor GrpE [Planctomycetota bacterium]
MKNKTINNKETGEKSATPPDEKASNTSGQMTSRAGIDSNLTQEIPTGIDETPGNKKTCAIPSEEQLEELQNEIESLRKAASERDEFLNLLQRVQADFANYQKRIKKEKECWDKYQDEDLLKELIPVLDNLERTLKMQCSSGDARCLMDGVQLIKREIFRVLEKRGVKQIKTTGEKFDANIHESVAVTESEEHKENEIIEEISPGFMLYDRLVRAAKVRVAVNPKPKQEKTEEKETQHKDTGK